MAKVSGLKVGILKRITNYTRLIKPSQMYIKVDSNKKERLEKTLTIYMTEINIKHLKILLWKLHGNKVGNIEEIDKSQHVYQLPWLNYEGVKKKIPLL